MQIPGMGRKAVVCRYCLDNRRALERDVGYAELQTRLIRYETQTTCTKECCPVPVVLSPLPSPAVMSEPGSVPDGESLQSEFKTEASRLKGRSKDLDCFYPKKRLTKSESTDSLLSQASGSSGNHYTVAVTRKRSERSVSLASMALKQPGQTPKVTSKADSASCKSATESETSKPAKESRSQKHTRMLKEVVAKTLQKHGIAEDHKCFTSCSQRLFEISKFYLKDLKTSRGLLDEMKKTANNNAKQKRHTRFYVTMCCEFTLADPVPHRTDCSPLLRRSSPRSFQAKGDPSNCHRELRERQRSLDEKCLEIIADQNETWALEDCGNDQGPVLNPKVVCAATGTGCCC
ncbi:hypothetical protein llap_4125 [Limosa lapponica baueri]|uniref:MDN2-binding protein C-terminal domain-containing protein n=1 Tax=Limosa lapponica baueri TaxID=1758121 RepID=A0A2I0UHN5_LIMLA|nr:hypothetical protein llap_4125 [Limosa lapponica baueri]